jgi:hypothetical protein
MGILARFRRRPRDARPRAPSASRSPLGSWSRFAARYRANRNLDYRPGEAPWERGIEPKSEGPDYLPLACEQAPWLN